MEALLGANAELPTLKSFLEFLTSRFRTLGALNIHRKTSKFESLTTITTKACSICNKDHYVNQSDKFREMDEQQRKNEARKQNLCFNCLRKGHGVNQCPSTGRCRTQLLGLRRRFSKIHICGVGAGARTQSKSSVELVIKAKYGGFTNVSTLILTNITNSHPSTETPIKLPAGLSVKKLADPQYGILVRIDILLGTNIYNEIVLAEFEKGSPCAVNTRFGWILLDSTSARNNQEGILTFIATGFGKSTRYRANSR